MSDMDLSTAESMIDAAEQKANELDAPVCIAVLDEGGRLVALHRMDGAPYATVTYSQKKAHTACGNHVASHHLQEASEPGGAFYGLQGDSDLTVLGGGYPVERGDDVVGAIGVAGGTVDEDMEIAEAGLEGF
jgi:uncharacterized protein GlcG (DUF336 family)